MNTLSPSQAAAMADGVYLVRGRSIAELRRVRQPLGCEPMFGLAGEDRFKGVSGSVVKLETGFGYLAEGEGVFQGELACVTRGTLDAYDWASNINVALQVGPGGHLVHAGFNEVWKSFRPMLDAYLRNRNPTHIHCVGHSLGGALAFLNADYFTMRNVAPVSVYTFGSPRAGTTWFAQDLTDKIGADRVFRTGHVADPVPMIPLFPFYHVPIASKEYVVNRQAGGAFISASAHSMKSSYIPGVTGRDWGSLLRTESNVTDSEIQSWLTMSSQGGGVLAYSAEALRMIGRLLQWMLRKAGAIVLGSVSLGITVGATLLDQLAGMIAAGARLSKELAGAGMAMARAIFRFLGYAAASTYDLTMQFLRWLLQLLFSSLAGMASRAVALL